jgi:hypothetical protein
MGKGKPAEEVMRAAGAVSGSITGPQAPASPDPAIEDERRKLGLLRFLQSIQPLFLKHFFDEPQEELDGYTFAEDFLSASESPTGQLVFTPQGPMTELGKQQYSQVKAGGPIQFDRIIRDYHPIWSLVGGNMPKYQEFLKQFFNFFEDAEKAHAEKQAKLSQVPSVPKA